MRCEIIKYEVWAGSDAQIPGECLGHELPILLQAWGGEPQNIIFKGRTGVFRDVPDPAAEYDRMRKRYRSTEDGTPWVDVAYPGVSALTFARCIEDGDTAIQSLEAMEAARVAPPDAGASVQPKEGEKGSLTKAQLAAMVAELTGEPVNPKTSKLAGLRARLMLALEEAFGEEGLPVPNLATDPELSAAYAALQNHRAGKEGGDG